MALDRDGVIKQVEKLSEAPSVYEGLKEKAQAFLRAVDTPGEKPAYAALMKSRATFSRSISSSDSRIPRRELPRSARKKRAG